MLGVLIRDRADNDFSWVALARAPPTRTLQSVGVTLPEVAA
jgi:hypothetical protein